ncbi:NAD(P)/FAD-dependent oxidoreductase [Oecophyllibacter saccharovorans]|uniref:Ferredoxin--NADP reductase n=1 Tax=Oecophyllibacter saccharovorans TaxID=2558360 RepID=A0A506ULN1_9PROT|nr:NAD(P)/FAD-dependent oxidoreductase [Oecophyllibacter saccharovorans]TPW34239.1 NAD(P)/FAD-dependent oxidoreductase [Oecophyllibacter saccharovorans]
MTHLPPDAPRPAPPSAAPRQLETDIAIIGAGPVGLFAAFECSMLRLGCVLMDVLDTTGGQCAALYPEKPIYDIPAHPSITGGGLIEALEAQIAPFDVPRLLGSQVVELTGEAGNFTLRNTRGDTVRAKAVIIAAGAGAFGPNRPPLEGLEAFEATGSVQYYVRKRSEFAGKRVVVAGGGDSALDWALSLSEVAAHVCLLHRRDRFRGAPDTLARIEERIAEGRVEKIVPYQLHALHGEAGALTHVEAQTLDGQSRLLAADVLLPFYGLSTDLGPIAQWGLETHRTSIPVEPATMATNIPGIHAIGDVAQYPGKLKLILQGFSEGAVAAHAAFATARPEEALRFEHSTSRGAPGA